MVVVLPDLAWASQTTLLAASLLLSAVLLAFILRWPRFLWAAMVIGALFGLSGASVLVSAGYRHAMIHEFGLLYFLTRALLFSLPLLTCFAVPLLEERQRKTG